MGSLLSLKTKVEQWQNVLESEMWELEEMEKGLFAPLLLSYYDLPPNLRKCFSYCAVFPKDYEIEKDQLIKFWMAQGCLKVKGTEDMELVGEEYFENLAMRSLFQDLETNNKDGSIIRCKMHDVVHDFTRYLTKNEFAGHRARHSMILFLRDDSFPISVSNESKLQSLVIKDYCDGDLLTSATFAVVFDKCRCLRVLGLDGSYSSIEKIPRGLGNLIHLRYLSLEEFRGIKELPEALCDLYNLQTLDISFCTRLEKLPKGIGKLINLRHLMNIQTSLSYMPKEMERLTNLRTISEFPVSCYGHDSKACTLQCLKNFKYLQGSLEIEWFGNVTDISEVKGADMKSMRNLLHLDLSFYKKEEEVEEVRPYVEHKVVLEALQPPPTLEKLEIWFYKSKTMTTNWMASLTNLKMLEIHSSENLQRLPSLGKLPSLESLSIHNMDSLRTVGREFLGIQSADTTIVAFPKLKSLEFNTIAIWEEWDYELLGGEDIAIMSCLHSLKLVNYPKLKALTDHIRQSTTKLQIYDCNNL